MLSAADREIRLGIWKIHLLGHAASRAAWGRWLLEEFRPSTATSRAGDAPPGVVANGSERRKDPMSRLLGSMESNAPRWTILIRIAVGAVFTSEGIQKFLYPDALGAGRFAKIGIPAPDVMGPFVGAVETACGLLVLAGLLTRLAAVPLLVDMLVAIASTKLPILLGRGYFLFSDPSASKTGLWSMMHEARTDLAMLLGSSFLLLVGAGAWSLDALLRRHIGSNTGGQR